MPPRKDPLRFKLPEGSNIWALTSATLIALLGLPALNGICKVAFQPCPLRKGPGLEILFLPHFFLILRRQQQQRWDSQWKKKKGAKREKGGFQTEHLHVEDYWAGQGLQRLFNSTQGKTEVPKHTVHCYNARHGPQCSTSLYIFGDTESFENLLKAMDPIHEKNAHLHIISRAPLMLLGQCFPQLAWW